MSKTLRERYHDNEIMRIGDIVEDAETATQMKIIDRGSNYITVADSNGGAIRKRWLNEVLVADEPKVQSEYELTESGQIAIYGYQTRNLSRGLAELLEIQLHEVSELYAVHQIVKLLDEALGESDRSRQYDLLEKVEYFFGRAKVPAPMIIEGMKSGIERRRIVDIIAGVAGTEILPSMYATAVSAIKELKSKFKTRDQWLVLTPLIKIAFRAGVTGITQNLPFDVSTQVQSDASLDEAFLELFEEHLDDLVEDLGVEDIQEAFEESDLSDVLLNEEQLNEVLGIQGREKLGRKLAARAATLAVYRARALSHGATGEVLQARARRLAETMLKLRMFRKPLGELSRQEKERFEAGASRRKQLVARLAMRLIPKVRQMQADRLHSAHTEPHAGAS